MENLLRDLINGLIGTWVQQALASTDLCGYLSADFRLQRVIRSSSGNCKNGAPVRGSPVYLV